LAANQSWTNNGSNATPINVTGTVTTGGNVLTFAGAGGFNVLQPITGGTVNKTGLGALNLYAANTNTALTITGGAVHVTPPNAATNPLGTGTVTLTNSTLGFNSSFPLAPVGLTAASFNRDSIAAVSESAQTF